MLHVLIIIRKDDKQLEHKPCLQRAGTYKIYIQTVYKINTTIHLKQL